MRHRGPTGNSEWGETFARLAERDAAADLTAHEFEDFATAAYMIGREDDYIEIKARAYQAHLGAGDEAAAVRAAFWIGLTLLFRGEGGRGAGWLARAEGLVREMSATCAEAGYLLLPQVEAAFSRGDTSAALEIGLRALEIGKAAADADLAAVARHLVGRAHMIAGDTAAGLAQLDETMVDAVEGILSPIVTGLLYCSVIEACQRYLAYERAAEWTEALSDWCAAQPGLVAFTGRCLIHRSEILVLRGDWTAAEREARAACARLAEGASAYQAGPAEYQRGEVFRLAGDYAQADRCYRAASTLGFDPQPGLALMRLAEGRMQSAGSAIRRALAASREPTARMRLLPAAAEIALAGCDLEAARALSDELDQLARTYASDVAEALSAEVRARLALGRNDPATALSECAAASRLWHRLPAPYRLCRLRLLSGRACVTLGDRETGIADIEAARDGFSKLGAKPDLKEASAVLGVVSSGPDGPLTKRQLQVLRLIAEGLTNREIAARLDLSERTVDRHVSDILTRIDAPTRAAATAYAASNGLLGQAATG